MYKIIFAITVLVLTCLLVEAAKRNEKMFNKCILLVSFFYFCGLSYLTLLEGIREGITGISIKFPLPFTKAIQNHMFGIVAQRSLLNMLLFIPFGYLLPNIVLLYKKKITWWQTTVFGFVTSLIIESTQLFLHRGVYELDDLVKNTLGTISGFFLYWILESIYKEKHYGNNL